MEPPFFLLVLQRPLAAASPYVHQVNWCFQKIEKKTFQKLIILITSEGLGTLYGSQGHRKIIFREKTQIHPYDGKLHDAS